MAAAAAAVMVMVAFHSAHCPSVPNDTAPPGASPSPYSPTARQTSRLGWPWKSSSHKKIHSYWHHRKQAPPPPHLRKVLVDSNPSNAAVWLERSLPAMGLGEAQCKLNGECTDAWARPDTSASEPISRFIRSRAPSFLFVLVLATSSSSCGKVSIQLIFCRDNTSEREPLPCTRHMPTPQAPMIHTGPTVEAILDQQELCLLKALIKVIN